MPSSIVNYRDDIVRDPSLHIEEIRQADSVEPFDDNASRKSYKLYDDRSEGTMVSAKKSKKKDYSTILRRKMKQKSNKSIKSNMIVHDTPREAVIAKSKGLEQVDRERINKKLLEKVKKSKFSQNLIKERSIAKEEEKEVLSIPLKQDIGGFEADMGGFEADMKEESEDGKLLLIDSEGSDILIKLNASESFVETRVDSFSLKQTTVVDSIRKDEVCDEREGNETVEEEEEELDCYCEVLDNKKDVCPVYEEEKLLQDNLNVLGELPKTVSVKAKSRERTKDLNLLNYPPLISILEQKDGTKITDPYFLAPTFTNMTQITVPLSKREVLDNMVVNDLKKIFQEGSETCVEYIPKRSIIIEDLKRNCRTQPVLMRLQNKTSENNEEDTLTCDETVSSFDLSNFKEKAMTEYSYFTITTNASVDDEEEKFLVGMNDAVDDLLFAQTFMKAFIICDYLEMGGKAINYFRRSVTTSVKRKTRQAKRSTKRFFRNIGKSLRKIKIEIPKKKTPSLATYSSATTFAKKWKLDNPRPREIPIVVIPPLRYEVLETSPLQYVPKRLTYENDALSEVSGSTKASTSLQNSFLGNYSNARLLESNFVQGDTAQTYVSEHPSSATNTSIVSSYIPSEEGSKSSWETIEEEVSLAN